MSYTSQLIENNLVHDETTTARIESKEEERKWGVFEDLADKKRRIDEACAAATDTIKAILGDVPVPDVQFAPGMSNIIDEATDHYIAELDTYLVHTIGWTGMRLRHVCPVCRARMTSKCAALFCGHVFCRDCIRTQEIASDDEEEGEGVDQPHSADDTTTDTDTLSSSSLDSSASAQYLCGVCRSYSGGMLKIYL